MKDLLLSSLLIVATFFSFSSQAQCVANYTFTTAPNSLTVQFNDSSSHPVGMQMNYYWWFSDGNSSSRVQNPTYTFSQAGTYIVYLSIFDSLNTCFDSTSHYVTVPGASPPCTASFSYQIQPNGQNSIVSFTNQSSFYSDSAIFTYDFGDNQTYSTKATLGTLNPQHTYSPGNYVVSLSIIDSLNNSTCFFIDTISIPVNPIPCTVDFAYSLSPQQNTTLVDFINLSQNFDSSGVFTYNFGDGNSVQINASSASIDTQWVYSPGNYEFELSFFDPLTTDSCSKSDSIRIPYNQYCNADFDVSFQGDSAYFINRAIGYTSLVYYFGDGDSSNLPNPIHEYNQSNTYTVSQVIFDSLSNCTDTLQKDIDVTISTSCVANFVPAIDTTKKQLLYLINQSSDISTHQYQWDFGDGSFGSGRTPSHEYDDFGTYPICLTVSDANLNCVSTFCDTIGLDSNSRFIRKANGFTLRVLDGGAIGVEENNSLKSISVYPNPFRDQINLDLSGISEQLNYQLVSINGQVVAAGILDGSNHILNMNHLENGVYYLILNQRDRVERIKVIKLN